MTLPARFRSDTLLPLWRAVHRRLSSGHPVSRVKIGPLDSEQRAAVADLLGMARYPGEYAVVSVARLDEVLHESVGMDARSMVTEVVGPIGDRAGQRARASAEREELWQWLAEHDVIRAQPALREWVTQVRRAGVIGGSVPETSRLLESALLVLQDLPAGGVPLPAFAERVLGDPHILDDGTRLSGLVLRALATLYDVDVPSSAEQRRSLWERAGVANDDLSTIVLVSGLRPHEPGIVGEILRTCADAGQAAALTLAQVRSTGTLSLPGGAVWIVENPSLLSLALRRFGAHCPPMVCTSGWPNSAGILLLRRLADGGASLHYHGDLDGEGLRIAAHVMAKTGAVPWRMGAVDYLEAVHDVISGPPAGHVTETPWDPALAEAMREHGTAIVEERLAELLLADLNS